MNAYEALPCSYGAVSVAASNCRITCPGNPNEVCGGYSKLTVYRNPANAVGDYPSLEAGWKSLGCIADNINNTRTLSDYVFTSDNMTISLCVDGCSSKGFAYAGIEYSRECYCAQKPHSLEPSTKCSMSCPGDVRYNCGGPAALNMVRTAWTCKKESRLRGKLLSLSQVHQYRRRSTRLHLCGMCCGRDGWTPAHWQHHLRRRHDSRCLHGLLRKVWPNVQWCGIVSGIADLDVTLKKWADAMTTCSGRECYCGSTFVNGGTGELIDESRCAMPCKGDSSVMCGGSSTLSLFKNPSFAPAAVTLPS